MNTVKGPELAVRFINAVDIAETREEVQEIVTAFDPHRSAAYTLNGMCFVLFNDGSIFIVEEKAPGRMAYAETDDPMNKRISLMIAEDVLEKEGRAGEYRVND